MNRYAKIFLQMSVPFGIITGLFDAWNSKNIVGSLISGAISGVFFGCLMTTFAYIAFRVYSKNRPDAFDVYQKKSMTISKPIDTIKPACKKAVLSIKKAKILEEINGGRTIKAKIGMSWKSFGEIMNITLKETDLHTTTLDISSGPALKSTIIDYGKNADNVGAVAEYLHNVFQESANDA